MYITLTPHISSMNLAWQNMNGHQSFIGDAELAITHSWLLYSIACSLNRNVDKQSILTIMCIIHM